MDWLIGILPVSPYVILYTLHLIGIVFGVGGVTVTDVFSIYAFFIKKQALKEHVETFKIFSLLIWAGIILMSISAVALIYISKVPVGGDLPSNMYEIPMQSAMWWPMLILFGVVVLNGLFLNFVVTPGFDKAIQIPNFQESDEWKKAFRIGLISGTISFVSWWGVFLLCIYLFRVIS